MTEKFSTKPYVFYGVDFLYQCKKTKAYIMAQSFDIWQKVAKPYDVSNEINTTAEKN